MSTHDIFRAKTIADRVGIMKEGRMVMMRTREEFMSENLESIYLDYMLGKGRVNNRPSSVPQGGHHA